MGPLSGCSHPPLTAGVGPLSGCNLWSTILYYIYIHYTVYVRVCRLLTPPHFEFFLILNQKLHFSTFNDAICLTLKNRHIKCLLLTKYLDDTFVLYIEQLLTKYVWKIIQIGLPLPLLASLWHDLLKISLIGSCYGDLKSPNNYIY